MFEWNLIHRIYNVTRIFWHYAQKIPSPCNGLGCGTSANTCAARNRTVAMRACKHVEKISSGPLTHDYGHQGFKTLNLDHFWTCFSHFGGLPYWIGKKKKQKIAIDLWGHGDFFISWLLFLSCIFWPPGIKKWFFHHFWKHFDHFGGLPYYNGKKIKWKNCVLSIPI